MRALGALLLLSLGSASEAQNKVFSAMADARVRQDMRMVNFGSDELGVETDMRAPNGFFERSFLRFEVGGITPAEVDCVTLELTVTTPGDCHFEVRRVTGSWDESQLSWFNMPDSNGTRLGAWSGQPLTAGSVLHVPLDASGFSAGNGVYSLVLVEFLGGGTTRVGFDSREGSAAPRLIIGCTGLPARAGISATRLEGAIPFTPDFQGVLPADVTMATWDFGDGSAPQVALVPQHTYTSVGRFSVSVSADSPAGTVQVSRPNYIFAHRPDGQAGTLIRYEDVNDVTAGSVLNLNDEDYFGRSVGAIGDLDGDGIIDLMVGAVGDDEAHDRAGAVYILFMRKNGSVRSSTKITEGRGGFGGDLDIFDGFGRGLAPIGDLDGDGVLDIAVGANGDDDVDLNSGAVWILYLNTNGTVKNEAKINSLNSATLNLNRLDEFGRGIACVGDLDGDGVQDLAVSAIGDDRTTNNFGCVWVLFMNANGSVKLARRISGGEGGLNINPVLSALGLWFGFSVAPIGDVNGDGTIDIVVGAILDDSVRYSSGAAVVLLLSTEGTVVDSHLINGSGGGFDSGELWSNDQFGGGVAGIGDVDRDGIPDIAVSSIYDDDNLSHRTDLFEETGALYVLFLNSDGSVRDYQKISATRGGLNPGNSSSDRMGEGLAGCGDLDGDGSPEILVGSRFYNAGGANRGNLNIMHLRLGNPAPTPNIVELGCGVNPAGSLQVLAGSGRIGTSTTFGLTNPLGTQPAGSQPFLALSVAPDINFPCGTLFNGLGMGGGPGELLIQISPPPFRTLTGPLWGGEQTLSPVVINVPGEPVFIGLKLYVQGRLLDFTPGAPLRLGLTGAFEITLIP